MPDKDKKRVFYIPDCGALVQAHIRSIKEALLFTFHDDPRSCDKIMGATTTQDLLNFIEDLTPYSLYVIVDQTNALESPNLANDRHGANKVELGRFFGAMSARQMYLFSASANEQSARNALGKQSGNAPIYFYSGMDDVRSYSFRLSPLTSPRLKWPLGGTATPLL